jgi:hypothetical protein
MKKLKYGTKFYSHYNKVLKQVDKRDARKLFNLGETIYLTSSECTIGEIANNINPIEKDNDDELTFDECVSEFNYYKLNRKHYLCNEGGLSRHYPTYYIEVKPSLEDLLAHPELCSNDEFGYHVNEVEAKAS